MVNKEPFVCKYGCGVRLLSAWQMLEHLRVCKDRRDE